ncbi:hypothetical protein BN194_22820 [Lacticaseibacillus paracasei]|nr:hypothetical protein Lpp37_06542 [Lacticaseibacillus paracasei subsp. paracasei Lpp37]ERN48772.1 hypothetical protein N422_11685 [Lacticaseibacillus paracasei]CCK23229.1 hypothetical protein BN194_22820 [Lacticaseibacillus paracasei]
MEGKLRANILCRAKLRNLRPDGACDAELERDGASSPKTGLEVA